MKFWGLILWICWVVVGLRAHDINFIPNVGQWEYPFLYSYRFANGEVFFFKNKIRIAVLNEHQLRNLLGYKLLPFEEKQKKPIPSTWVDAHAFDIEFVGANNPTIETKGESEAYYNFFYGQDPSRWKSGLRAYRELLYSSIYKNIDIRFYSSHEALKYDVIVKPGGDPNDVQLKFIGLKKINIRNNRLKLLTAVGDIEEYIPRAYQINGKDTVWLTCLYKLNGNVVSYYFPSGYDSTKALYIDPILVFCSYSGSTADNWGYTATYDDQGHLFTGGNAFNIGYPTTTGAYQVNYGGNVDIVISKYSQDGSSLMYSTYLGGSGPEVPASLIANAAGELYIMAITGSSNFPVTSGAFDMTFNGGTSYTLTYVIQYSNGSDVAISCFNALGTQLLYSTYLGGTKNDGLNVSSNLKHNYADDVRGEVLIDAESNVYVVGSTNSTDFPVTPGVFQPTPGGGGQDGFITKLDRTLSQLIWSSYLGGQYADAIYNIALSKNGTVYVCGGTNSPDFPTTSGVVYPTQQGGVDGFVTMINPNGTSIFKSTYWGTSSYDQVYFVEIDKQNYVYILGQSSSTGNALIQNAAWYTVGGGQFIAKLTPLLNSIIWSTRFGTGNGVVNISPTAFLVDYCNNIYLSGWGSNIINGFGGTSGLPITPDAFQQTTDNNDYYFLAIRADASGIVFGSYFGGSQSAEHVDGGTSRFDKMGKIYQSICAGCGGHDDLPTTPGAWSNYNNSTNCNNGVVKIDFALPAIVADFDVTPVVCLPDQPTFTNNSHFPNPGIAQCFWDFGDGGQSTNCNPTHAYSSPGVYTVTLIVSDASSCNMSDTVTKTVVVMSNTTSHLPDVELCIGQSAHIGISPLPASNITYTWYPSTGLSNPHISNPLASPTTTTLYRLVVDNGVCRDTFYQQVKVWSLQVDAGQALVTCKLGDTLMAHATGGSHFSYQWSSNPAFTDTLNANDTLPYMLVPTSTSHWYYVRVSNGLCTAIDSVFVDYQPLQIDYHTTLPSCYDYSDGTITLTPQTGVGPYHYLWNTGDTTGSLNQLQAGTYQVTVTDAEGCETLLSITLAQPEPLTAQLLPYAVHCQEACNGKIYLFPSGGTMPYTYSWSNGSTTQDQTGLCVGTYSVTITDKNNCHATYSVSIPIDYIYQNADAWADKDTIYQGQSVGIHAKPLSSMLSYEWTPHDFLLNPYSPNTMSTPPHTITYYLKIDDGEGCIYEDSVTIVVVEVFCYEPYIYVPNSFTPNGDGVNDVLYVRSLYIDHMYFAIFDRWGEKVFETTDPKVGWDGTYHGKLLEPQVFDYYLEAYCYNQQVFRKKGNITLIR